MLGTRRNRAKRRARIQLESEKSARSFQEPYFLMERLEVEFEPLLEVNLSGIFGDLLNLHG